MLDIVFVNETDFDTTGFDTLITEVFHEAMKTENIDKYYEVSVVFVTKERIQEINRTYRGIDRVTDVISFALLDDEDDIIFEDDEEEITVLGDIFICLEVMKEQAKEYGHSEKRELAFLALHGLLHLLGYDHDTPMEEKEMFAKQDYILNNLGITRG
ncbi:MAG: rRNA maturation RNase YbeY [Bacilli bacterium]|nr:rRNA maturation RNase YbeY [Bacilli bacterium]